MENKLFPLSNPQKRIWNIEEMHPEKSINNIGGTMIIHGKVDINLLERSIALLIAKNEGLRLRIGVNGQEPFQYIEPYKNQRIRYIDFTCESDPQEAMERWADFEFKKTISIMNNDLFEFVLFKIDIQKSGFYLKLHHIIADGWSIQVICEKIKTFYTKLLKQVTIDEEMESSYIHYLDCENAFLNSRRAIKQRDYWMKKFSALPERFLYRSADSIEGNRKSFFLDKQKYQQIDSFCNRNAISLNVFFISLFTIYLYKISQENDIIISTPILNRSGNYQKKMIGMCTSTMPIRALVDNEFTVVEYMVRTGKELIQGMFNQRYPYDRLVNDLRLREEGYSDLFQYSVNYYKTTLIQDIAGYPVEIKELYNGNQIYSLQVAIKEWSIEKGIEIQFDYKENDFNENSIENLYSRFQVLIDQIVSEPLTKLINLSILLPEEMLMTALVDHHKKSDYPDLPIHRLFEEQVLKAPENIAVICNETQLTYGELNKRSESLAVYLRQKGVVKNKIVGIMAEHSFEAVISILGVLKAGGAYLPIDPTYPEERINYILKDSGVNLLLTTLKPKDAISFNGEILDMNNFNWKSYDKVTLEQDEMCPEKDLAYVIYTSGTTGEPKGSLIHHKGLVNYIWWAKKTYISTSEDSFALYSSLSFDLTVTSIFTPLVSGSTIVIYEDNAEEFILDRIIKDNKATIIKLTPSHLSLLKEELIEQSIVKKFIVGGEDLKTELARKIEQYFKGDIEIYNEYGPTETVVGCMIYKYDSLNDNGASVPIGHPIDNMQIYIMDGNHRPVPAGVLGELYIAGDGVCRGYLNKPALTELRFIDNPMNSNTKMYKSGDIALYKENGTIEYYGRADHQVKIRGYRIETGEIEHVILQYASIEDVVVIDQIDELGRVFLAGYFTAGGPVSELDLRYFLLQFLPNYMVPAYLIHIEVLPLSPNGKVDRKQLLEFFERKKIEMKNNNVEDLTAASTDLMNVMREILKLDQIRMEDNFFSLGGDSIKAIQVVSKLREVGLKLTVTDILSFPVMRDLAAFAQKHGVNESNAITCEGELSPTPASAWFFSQELANRHHWNQSVFLELNKAFTIEQLQLALHKLVVHHDGLRLNYDFQSDRLFYQNTYRSEAFRIQEMDLSKISQEQQQAEIYRNGAALKKSMQIDSQLLLKAMLFHCGDKQKLLLTAHHLIIDGVSWRILLQDFNALLKERMVQLPVKTDSVQRWTAALDAFITNDLKKEIVYWNARQTDFSLPADYYHALPSKGPNITSIHAELTAKETEKVMIQSNATRVTKAAHILLAALLLTLESKLSQPYIPIVLEGHGRNEFDANIDVSRTIGWFTSMYPASFKAGRGDIALTLDIIRESLDQIPNEGLGYSALAFKSKQIADGLMKKIRFNYLGELDNALTEADFTISADDTGEDICLSNPLTCLLDVVLIIVNGKLLITFTYDEALLRSHLIRELLDTFIAELRRVLDYCCSEERDIRSTDFETVSLSDEDLDLLLFS